MGRIFTGALQKQETIFIALVILSIITPVYAETEISYFNVDQYFSRSYTTTDWLINNSYKYWYRFRVEATLLEFNPPSSSTTFVYARPIGPDGTFYGTRYMVSNNHTTTWIPNTAGMFAIQVRFKFYNPLYETNTIAHIQCRVSGTV